MKAAIETTRTLGHAAVLLPAETFLQMGRLRPYEEMRNAHKLTFRDSLEHLRDIEGSGAFILFISHQVRARLTRSGAGALSRAPRESHSPLSLPMVRH